MTKPELETLNGLLKGELSAREVYGKAIRKFGKSAEQTGRETQVLKSIKENHEDAIGALSDYVRQSGGEPVKSSGAWGSYASMVHGSAQVIGDGPALSVLRKGEEIGLAMYEKALRKCELSPDAQNHIRDSLVPKQFRHIQILRVLTDSI